MGLPNVNIVLGNGSIGVASLSDDGISALILTGVEGADPKLNNFEDVVLKKIYVLSSAADLDKLGISENFNELAYKEVTEFYRQAPGVELHLMFVSEATTMTQICTTNGTSPLKIMIDHGAGRIRLIGINKIFGKDKAAAYADVIDALNDAQAIAEQALTDIAPVHILLPAVNWEPDSDLIPTEQSFNRVALVAAAYEQFLNGDPVAAIGQVLGRAASIPVHHSIARVRDGAIATTGYLMDGKKPEECFASWNNMNDNGYIFYRTYVGKNGYYLNGDPMCIATTDDYCRLSLGRTIDKAVIIAYKTYIDDILDNIMVDDKGKIPVPVCKSFEASIIRAVNTLMGGEISSFNAYVNPNQDVLTTGSLTIDCKVVPQATLREIKVNLSLNNPTSNG